MLSLLLLLTAPLGVSSACPLTLEPAELVLEFGEAAVVNCSTPVDGHRGLSWTHGTEGQGKDLGSFTVLQIERIDWNTSATCNIKLNDTHDCSKDLEIKVYKRPSSVSVHRSRVIGDQLELRCEVQDVAVLQNLSVAWYVNNNSTVVDTQFFLPQKANSRMNVTSTLTWTVGDQATFTCEASETGPHHRRLYSSKQTRELSVQYAPKFEESEHNVLLNDSSEATLHCEAKGNPPPHYLWLKEGSGIRLSNQNDLTVSKGQVNKTTTFVCVSANVLGFAKKNFIVIVMETTPAPSATTVIPAAPKSSVPDCPITLAPDEILVRFGSSTSANCSTTEEDVEGLSWEATTGGTGLTPGTHLQWTVSKVDAWDIRASCARTLNSGSQCVKPLSITVWKSPDEVQLSPRGNSSVAEGRPHQLKCDIFNVAPVNKLQVKFYQGNKLLHTDRDTFTGSDKTPTNVTSIWEVTPEREDTGALFTCEAELLLQREQEENPKVVSDPHSIDVQYKPSVVSCQNYVGREGDARLDSVQCKADGNPEPSTLWYFDNKRVDPTEPLTRRDTGNYRAGFTNSMGSTSTIVYVSIEYRPSFSCRDQYDVTEHVHLGYECQPEGKPEPKTAWFKDGIEIALPKIWKREDSGQYSIVATNNHGQATHNLSINVMYIPRFSEGDITKEYNLGENVTLECSADGNPPPQIHWSLHPTAANLKQTTRGSPGYMYITEATSSNAGVYSCTATNQAGTVSTKITLMIADKPRAVYTIIFIAIALFIFLLLCVSVLLYRHYRKKSGRYNVIADNLPLTTRS